MQPRLATAVIAVLAFFCADFRTAAAQNAPAATPPPAARNSRAAIPSAVAPPETAEPATVQPAPVAPATGGSACDRICLTGLLEQYLSALAQHDPSAAPLAPEVRFTENTVKIPVGEGLWLGVTQPPTTFRVAVIDPVSSQAGFYGLLTAWGRPALVAIRIKVQGNKITEAEHIVARQLRPQAMTNLVTPRAGLLEDVPPKERNSREAMTHIALSYFDAIELDRGEVAPFADECQRHENGLQTTGNKTPPPLPPGSKPGSVADAIAKIGMLGCKAGIDSQVLSYITRIEPRRPLIVDEQKGLMFTFPMFVHRGDVQSIQIKGVPGVESIPASSLGASNLMAGEIFKIRNSRIYEIEAVGVLLPYLSSTGWDDGGAAAATR
jgi:hypothetical protein